LLDIQTVTEFAEQIIDEDDDTICAEILRRMEKLIPGLTDTVDYTRIARWNEMIVYSRPGRHKHLGQFQARRAAVSSRIQLAGVFRSPSKSNNVHRDGVGRACSGRAGGPAACAAAVCRRGIAVWRQPALGAEQLRTNVLDRVHIGTSLGAVENKPLVQASARL
jgi:hypothetical protein